MKAEFCLILFVLIIRNVFLLASCSFQYGSLLQNFLSWEYQFPVVTFYVDFRKSQVKTSLSVATSFLIIISNSKSFISSLLILCFRNCTCTCSWFSFSVSRVCLVSILLLNINCCLDWFVTICLAVISSLGGETLNFSKYLKVFRRVLCKCRDK